MSIISTYPLGYCRLIKLRPLIEVFAAALLGIYLIQLSISRLSVLVFGSIFLLIAFRRPVLGVLAMILSTSSIMHVDTLSITPGVTASDMIFLTLVLLYALRRAFGLPHNPLRSPLTPPFVAALSMVVLVALESVLLFDLKPGVVYTAGRGYVYYAFFLLVLGLISKPADVRFLIRSLLTIGIVVTLMMVAQVFIGPGTRLFLGSAAAVRIGFGADGAVRFLTPGEPVVMFCFFYSISRASIGQQLRNRRTMLLIASICPIAFVLSMTRVTWLGLITALVFGSLFYFRKIGAKIVISIFTVAASLLLVLALGLILLSSAGYKQGGMLEAAAARFLSIFEEGEYETGSTAYYRWQEYQDMKPYLQKYFVSGLGFGNPYRLFWDKPTQRYQRTGYYVHNGVLAILLPMGLGGLIVFFWLFYAALRYCARKLHHVNDPFAKSLALATFLTIIAMVVTLAAQPTLSNVDTVPVVALILGLTVLAVRQAERAKSLPQDGGRIPSRTRIYRRNGGQTRFPVNHLNRPFCEE